MNSSTHATLNKKIFTKMVISRLTESKQQEAAGWLNTKVNSFRSCLRFSYERKPLRDRNGIMATDAAAAGSMVFPQLGEQIFKKRRKRNAIFRRECEHYLFCEDLQCSNICVMDQFRYLIYSFFKICK